MELSAGSMGFLVGVGVTIALTLTVMFTVSGDRERRDKRRQRDQARASRREPSTREPRLHRQDDEEPWAGPVELPRESRLHIPPADVQKIEGVAPRNEVL